MQQGDRVRAFQEDMLQAPTPEPGACIHQAYEHLSVFTSNAALEALWQAAWGETMGHMASRSPAERKPPELTSGI
eukprot:3546958-Prorocentrum_lima.AAC.1